MKDIVLLDGATGTRLWALAEAAGYAKTPTWLYNMEHPELVIQAEREYIAAGTKLICTNTFAANGPEVERASAFTAPEVVRAGVRIARDAVSGSDTKVALDIGPLAGMLEPYGYMTRAEAERIFSRQIGSGMEEAPDCIFLETFVSLEMMKIAAAEALKYGVPVLCSMSFQPGGRTLMGDAPAAIAEELTAMGVTAVGLNCSFGPASSLPILREFAAHTSLPLILKPNAEADCTPEHFAAELAPGLDAVSYIGACCGSDPRFIAALAKLL